MFDIRFSEHVGSLLPNESFSGISIHLCSTNGVKIQEKNHLKGCHFFGLFVIVSFSFATQPISHLYPSLLKFSLDPWKGRGVPASEEVQDQGDARGAR